MFRLTREVRFAINPSPDGQLGLPPANSYGGHPSPVAFGPFLTLTATVAGNTLLPTAYLLNIKEIDAAVRSRCLPAMADLSEHFTPATALGVCFAKLKSAFPAALESLSLAVSPFLTYEISAKEYPVIRLTQKFEFSASHRLHSAELSEEENVKAYGKCNNPHGHGHNYEVAVTLAGVPDPATGILVDLPVFERVVSEQVLARFDHRHLNIELPEFEKVIPTVENIAQVIYRLLAPKLLSERTRLSGVTVWETPKTWCSYSEE